MDPSPGDRLGCGCGCGCDVAARAYGQVATNDGAAESRSASATSGVVEVAGVATWSDCDLLVQLVVAGEAMQSESVFLPPHSWASS